MLSCAPAVRRWRFSRWSWTRRMTKPKSSIVITGLLPSGACPGSLSFHSRILRREADPIHRKNLVRVNAPEAVWERLHQLIGIDAAERIYGAGCDQPLTADAAALFPERFGR